MGSCQVAAWVGCMALEYRSKAMNSEIHVGQVISIHDDMNEFKSGEYKIKKLYENFKHVIKLCVGLFSALL